VSIYHVK